MFSFRLQKKLGLKMSIFGHLCVHEWTKGIHSNLMKNLIN